MHIVLYAEPLFHIGPIPITNSFFMMIVVMTLLLIVGRIAASRITENPKSAGRFGAAVEFLVGFLLNLVESTAGKKLGRKIFPLVSGLFIFILFANFSGLLPGVGTIMVGADHVPIMRPPTADLNMTLAMSTTTFIAVQIYGIRAHGVGGRLKHMADPAFIFPIEVISELSRIISLAARLFGNVFAGEVLLGVGYAIANAVKIAVVPVLLPVVFIGLEVLFGTIQALVFALLTLIYIFLAAAGHDDEEKDLEHQEREAHAEDGKPALAGD